MRLSYDYMLAGRYRVRKKIGAGSFGEIYLAKDMEQNMEVAIKTVSGRPNLF